MCIFELKGRLYNEIDDKDDDGDEMPVSLPLSKKPFGIAINTFLSELQFDNSPPDCLVRVSAEVELRC